MLANMGVLFSLKPPSSSHYILYVLLTCGAVYFRTKRLVPLDINMNHYDPVLPEDFFLRKNFQLLKVFKLTIVMNILNQL